MRKERNLSPGRESPRRVSISEEHCTGFANIRRNVLLTLEKALLQFEVCVCHATFQELETVLSRAPMEPFESRLNGAT
ncbi:hypothetical protein, partial [Propionivibrio sp.]|uniref:hypothetical protein n=1 Tax=Propionivibrio sp. TaxID=2212460 RepID=UPI003BF26D0F